MKAADRPPDLASALERLAGRYGSAWLDTDPLRWPRRYADPENREVVAVLAALLAYGRVASIQAAVGNVLARLGDRPAKAIDSLSKSALSRRLRSIRHRWTDGTDVAWLLHGLADIRREHGSLGHLLLASAEEAQPLRTAMSTWRSRAREARIPPSRSRARAFLLPDVRGGGACKRLLLLARWCVRRDDGVDLGLWKGPSLTPADLLVPLDVHVHAVALQLGLTARPRPDWRAAEEVTACLRTIDPRDPVRFDFALARLGIAGGCRHRFEADVCPTCDLRDHCVQGGLQTGATRTTDKPTTRSRTPPRSP